jgi:putative aldouronate transport system permease protein
MKTSRFQPVESALSSNPGTTWRRIFRAQGVLLLFILPGFVSFLLFTYVPFYGIIIAFQNYNPVIGFLRSPFVGLDNFRTIFRSFTFVNALRNTVVISFLKILFVFPMPILFALMIHELRQVAFKRSVQTISYLPHFISWVVAAGLWYKILSPNDGFVNLILTRLNLIRDPIYFMGRKELFYPIILLSAIWKDLGWGAIIYLASLTAINPELYESASIDGASRLRKMWHISLPGIKPTIVLLLILTFSNLLNAGFDQLQAMQNNVVLQVGEIIDTLVLRTLRVGGMRDLSYGAAMGFFKSVFGLGLFLMANRISRLLLGESLF